MPGTVEGGKRAAATNKAKYGKDYYQRIGKLTRDAWVANGRKPRGFTAMPKEKVQAAGRKGGTISRKAKI